MDKPRVGVLGGGSWATALVKLLCKNMDKVQWWMRNKEAIDHIRQFGNNPNYIQSIEFEPEQLNVTDNLQEVIDNSDYIIVAIPSAFVHETFQHYKPTGLENKVLFSAIKGVINEFDSIPARYFHKQFGVSYDNIGIVCGPCHAEEVAMEKLSYLTIGCADLAKADRMASMLGCRFMKTNTTEDVFGAELAAILKNVYAVASGICHGLGYGDNFQAVLVSNSLREMARVIRAVHPIKRQIIQTQYSGDLFVTMYSPFSRNRQLGSLLGKGYSLSAARSEMKMIAEGYYAAKLIREVKRQREVKMPIASAVYKVLYEAASPKKTMRALAEKLK